MSDFSLKNGVLHAESVSLLELATTYGTPLYVYSRAAIERQWRAFAEYLPEPHRVCFAVKANSNLAVLQVLARLGAGFDVVSGGEIARVLKAGGQAQRIVFSGVAKSDTEVREALQLGIGQFNVESRSELEQINRIALELGVVAAISLRVNPDVDAQTHPYIATGLEQNKFGIAMAEAVASYEQAAQLPGLNIVGVACHIGSQLTQIQPFLDAMDRMLDLIEQLAGKGIQVQHLDMGGGLGVRYGKEAPPPVSDYIQALLHKLSTRKRQSLALYLEPGRAIVANAGVLLTRVELLKSNKIKHFVMVDAGMNDLLRPSLYQAWHDIVNVQPRQGCSIQGDIVGPVCETGDFLGQNRSLVVQPGDLLAVMSAGAYGFTMSSNYNSRPRPAEVMVDRSDTYLIRARETREDLWRGESLIP
ncbi:diaminopimelate decarboxylase [Aliidiomarina quisquiliarum]|uniref:diaminopimelate decarboxylase n=1 Tax=Aliidiomarina quisquiliarum TaxID=2938947 RepID=UPI00208F8C56|nr:diaminopimelate decarboxylase [Aliidiomarina quisquiliarum]MCO4322504.1 diaminopimelate decarboxylase [Aliidiomarina quisquiliarum]